MEAGFTYLAQMPKKLSGFAAAELAGDIYIAGGNTMPGNTSSREMYAYNILNKTWTQKADLPPGSTSNKICTVYGKLYLFDRNLSNANRVYAYDPLANTWSDIAASAKTFSYVNALGGKIYCFVASNVVTDVFDPLTKTWSQAASRPDNSYIYSTTVSGGELYLNVSSGTMQRYNPDNNTWSSENAGYVSPFMASVYRDIYFFGSATSSEIKYICKYSTDAKMLTYYNSYFHEYNYFHQVCAVNNKVYIFAGHDWTGGAEAIVEYMPSVSPWMDKSHPVFLNYYMANAAIGSKIYLAGGHGETAVNAGCNYMTELYEYDTQANNWTQKQNMPTARSKAAGAAVGGKLYIIGGETSTSGSSTNKVEEYNPGNNGWSTKTTLPYTAHSVAAAAYNGKIYTFGGRNGTNGAFNYVYEYNPASNNGNGGWVQKYYMPTARYGASAVEINGRIYVAGGFNSSGVALNKLEVYNPESNSWNTNVAAMPEAKGYCGGAADGGVFIIGGSNGYHSVNTVYQYNPAMNKWYQWPGLDNAIEGVATAALNNGIYVINGGYKIFHSNSIWSNTLSSANYYTPTSSLYSYAELIHLGEDTINLTGNFSRTYTDLSYTAPGFNIEFTRTYNSHDTRASLISPGWSFGFQGKLDASGNNTIIRLPNGSGCTFKANQDNSFTALDSRSTLDKNTDNTYTLTTKDRYSYGFNTDGNMCWMKDRNGNTVTIGFNASGQVNKVTDQVGRVANIAYSNNKISTITDSAGRVVTYVYKNNVRLRGQAGKDRPG
jgi:N-acetylneuraminic acid mutarotase